MSYKKRLIWISFAAVLTGVFAYLTQDLIFNATRIFDVQSSWLMFFLALLVIMLGMIIANLPSLALLWYQKFPNAVVVAVVASIEAFLISLLTPILWQMIGFRYWIIGDVLALLVGYLLVDAIINQSRAAVKYKAMLLGVALVTTGLLYMGLLFT